MEANNSNFTLIGLPGSCKSTFIAALWHVIETNEINPAFTITGYPYDREYLNSLRTDWLGCVDVERTKVGMMANISLNVVNNITKKKSTLNFPDISGEIYKAQFEHREIDVKYIKEVQCARGLMIFVNPDDVKKPMLISVAKKMLPSQDEPSQSLKDWTHKDAPTQVVLIDLLQMITPFMAPGFKIGVIVSAWDVIMNSVDPEYNSLSPAQWVDRELPMFAQFLKSNFDYSIFGISAQGSSYGTDNSKLHDIVKQSERIIVQTGQDVTNDICQPINWLMDEGE